MKNQHKFNSNHRSDVQSKKTLEELLDEITQSFSESTAADKVEPPREEPSSIDEVKFRMGLDAEAVEAFAENAKIDRKLKNKYALPILICVGLQILAFNVIIVLYGCGQLGSLDAQVMQYYITGGVIEIVSLAAIIIRYLFSDNISKSLRYILEKNKIHK